MLLAVILAIAAPRMDADLSRRLTAAAEELLRVEKKIAGTEAGLDALLYDDVLSLLDAAVDANPQNIHAHARTAEVLLLKSDNGDGTFDICYLLDARDEADLVLNHASRGEPSDAAIARGVLRAIEKIPADAIPDPPSSCDEGGGQRHGTKTKSS